MPEMKQETGLKKHIMKRVGRDEHDLILPGECVFHSGVVRAATGDFDRCRCLRFGAEIIRGYTVKKYGPFCQIDGGLFAELARIISPRVEESHYYCRWEGEFPSLCRQMIGDFPGVNRILDYHDIIDEMADDGTWVFSDILFAGLQTHLEQLGHAVWGARHAEDLENFRVEFRELTKGLGLATPEYKIVPGAKLESYVEKNPGEWMKVMGYLRGMTETKFAESLDLFKPVLQKLQHDFGPYFKTTDFIMEKPIPKSVEIAYDWNTIDGGHSKKCCLGLEIKSSAFFLKLIDYTDLPPQIQDFNERMAPTWKDYRMRSNCPVELRVTEDGKYIPLDPCQREGFPSFPSKHLLIKNMADIYYAGARGEVVEPETDGDTCAMELVLSSEWCMTEYMPIYFPPKLRDNFFPRYAAEVDGVINILPQPVNNVSNAIFSANKTVGSIVTTGKSYAECRKKMDEIRDEFKGERLEYDLAALDKLESEWQKVVDFGVKMPKL